MQIHMWIFIRPVLRNFSYWVACSVEVFKTTKLQILHFYFFTERNQNLNARFWFTGTIVCNVKKARVIICTSVISLNSNVFYFKVKSIIKQFLVYVTPHISYLISEFRLNLHKWYFMILFRKTSAESLLYFLVEMELKGYLLYSRRISTPLFGFHASPIS